MAVLQEIKVPLVSVNDRSLTVIETPFSSGDPVKEGDTILVFETSKTTYDVEAMVSGYIQYLCVAGEDYEVDSVVGIIYDTVGEAQTVPQTVAPAGKTSSKRPVSKVDWTGKTLFSKGALELMHENKIDENVFAGRDFVNKEDILFYLGKSNNGQPGNFKDKKNSKPLSIMPVDETGLVVKKLSSNKKREIDYLSSVQSASITSTVNTYVDTEGIFVHLNESLKALKNSLLPVTIYEVSRLLRKYSELNAFYLNDSVYHYGKINIGFAIDIDQGLKVLKIADADLKSIGEIEEDIINVSGKYLDSSLHPGDLSDITFTITDLSSENVAFFHPLVNFMNSAILGISSIDQKLDRCTFTVTFDHRVTEGKLVARFLKEVKERLESYQSNHFTRQLDTITCFKCRRSLSEDLSDVGFVKCITPKGENAFICQSCLKGF